MRKQSKTSPPTQNLFKGQNISIKAHNAPVLSQPLSKHEYVYTYICIYMISYTSLQNTLDRRKTMFGKDSTSTCYFKMEWKCGVYVNVKENAEQMEEME